MWLELEAAYKLAQFTNSVSMFCWVGVFITIWCVILGLTDQLIVHESVFDPITMSKEVNVENPLSKKVNKILTFDLDQVNYFLAFSLKYNKL